MNYYLIPGLSRAKLDFKNIVQVVCDYYDVTPTQVLSVSRRTKCTLPRHVAMYILRKKTALTLLGIAKQFGRKDHTTVVNAEKKIKGFLDVNSGEIRKDVETILEKLK